MDSVLEWKPRAFTDEELQGIDPVIRAYLKDVDVTLLICNRRLTPEQRILRAQAYNADSVALIEAARKRRHEAYGLQAGH